MFVGPKEWEGVNCVGVCDRWLVGWLVIGLDVGSVMDWRMDSRID